MRNLKLKQLVRERLEEAAKDTPGGNPDFFYDDAFRTMRDKIDSNEFELDSMEDGMEDDLESVHDEDQNETLNTILDRLAGLKKRTNSTEDKSVVQEILKLWKLRNPVTYSESLTKINEIKTQLSIKIEE